MAVITGVEAARAWRCRGVALGVCVWLKCLLGTWVRRMPTSQSAPLGQGSEMLRLAWIRVLLVQSSLVGTTILWWLTSHWIRP